MGTPDELCAKIRATAEAECAVVHRAVALIGPDWGFRWASLSGPKPNVTIEGDHGFVTTLRRLRRTLGSPIVDRSIYPYSADQNGAHVSFAFDAGDITISVTAFVGDYTRLLRRGAVCKVISQAFVVKCEGGQL